MVLQRAKMDSSYASAEKGPGFLGSASVRGKRREREVALPQ